MATPNAAKSSSHSTRQVTSWHVVAGANKSWPKPGTDGHWTEPGGTRGFLTGAFVAALGSGSGSVCVVTAGSPGTAACSGPLAGACSAFCSADSGCPVAIKALAVRPAGMPAETYGGQRGGKIYRLCTVFGRRAGCSPTNNSTQMQPDAAYMTSL